MWLMVAIGIEGMALLGGAISTATRRSVPGFVAGFNTMGLVTGIFAWHAGIGPRAALVIAMVAVYLFRINWILLVWSRQTAIAKLDESTGPSRKLLLHLVLANTVGWGYCLPLYFATANAAPLGTIDGLGLGVYVLGTILHFGSDYQKRRFKLRPDAEGRLLETGFWALCRHPNYLGDSLIYISFALVGASIWGWIGPLLNLAQYAFDAIPKSERWAAKRYGPAWEAYRAKTKVFVPGLF